jgi:hypothetical protein
MPYRDLLNQRFGGPASNRLRSLAAARIPPPLMRFAIRHALNRDWFARGVVLDRCFLHRSDAALSM